MSRLKDLYEKKFKNELKKELAYKNVMDVVKLEKIVVNISQSEAIKNIKVLENAAADLTKITGQKPIITRAKKSIASFKLREGMPIGCCVTLRRERMYEFLDRLINVALPRTRDFRGVSSKSFDGNGNYNVGLKEQIIFPEIKYDKVDKIRGLNVTVCTTAKNDEHARNLLKLFNMPFR